MPLRARLSTMVRWCLVFVFLVAAVQKLADVPGFAGLLASSGFFGDRIAWIAWGIPLLELGIALALAFRLLEAPALCAVLLLSACFAGLHAYYYANGTLVPCGCAGVAEALAGAKQHLFMAIFCALLFLAGAGLLALSGDRGPTRVS
jgi:hypothetical protein